MKLNGNHIVSAAQDNQHSGQSLIVAWDLTSGLEIRTYESHQGVIKGLAFDKTTIISCSDNQTMKIWNHDCEETAALLRTFKGHTGSLNSIAMDDTHILSGSDDYSMKLWDRESRSLLHSFEGHASSVTAVAMDSSSFFFRGK
jgi:WD40 repeat protein